MCVRDNVVVCIYIYIIYKLCAYTRGEYCARAGKEMYNRYIIYIEERIVRGQTAIIVARGSRIPVTHGSVDRRGEGASLLPTGF